MGAGFVPQSPLLLCNLDETAVHFFLNAFLFLLNLRKAAVHFGPEALSLLGGLSEAAAHLLRNFGEVAVHFGPEALSLLSGLGKVAVHFGPEALSLLSGLSEAAAHLLRNFSKLAAHFASQFSGQAVNFCVQAPVPFRQNVKAEVQFPRDLGDITPDLLHRVLYPPKFSGNPLIPFIQKALKVGWKPDPDTFPNFLFRFLRGLSF